VLWRTLRKLKYGHPYEKLAAAETLSRSKKQRAFVALAKAISSEESEVRKAVIEAFSSMVRRNPSTLTQRYLPALTKALGVKELAVAMTITRAVIPWVPPPITDDLLLALEDNDPGVREAAAKTLVGTTEHRVIEALGRRLDDNSWEVQCAAADALIKNAHAVQQQLQQQLPLFSEPQASAAPQRGEMQHLISDLAARAREILVRQAALENQREQQRVFLDYQRQLLEPLRDAGRHGWASDANARLTRECREAVNRGGRRAMAAIGPILVKVLREAGQAELGCIDGIIACDALEILLRGGSPALPWVLQLPVLGWTGATRVGSPDESVVDFVGEYGSDDASVAMLLRGRGVNAEKVLAALRLVLGRCIVRLPADRVRHLSNLPNLVQEQSGFFGRFERTFDCSDFRAMAAKELTRRDALQKQGASEPGTVLNIGCDPTKAPSEESGEFYWP
jgi:hypothetical protein